MSIPDLGAINARNKLKAAIPPYKVTSSIFTLPSITPVGENGPSFTDAIDRAAYNLGIDGWRITNVIACDLADVAQSEQGHIAVFHVRVEVEPAPAEEDDTDLAESVTNIGDV